MVGEGGLALFIVFTRYIERRWLAGAKEVNDNPLSKGGLRAESTSRAEISKSLSECAKFFFSSVTQWYKLDEGQELQATLAHAFRCSVPRIVSRVDALLRGSEEPAPWGVLPGVGREPGCVALPCIYICN